MSDLEKIPDIDDFALQLEQFKNSLSSHATGGSGDKQEYIRMRKLLLENPATSEITPHFLKVCRNSDEFWEFIKRQFKTYHERREFIREVFNPIIEKIEYQEKSGSLEFTKNYQEKEILGHGGFGVVYLFEHKLLQMPFAVKIFAPAFSQGGEKELERFFREAKMLFSLNHPNIIKIYDAGMIGKRPFIRMEYFEGKNLNQILSEYGRLSAHRALVVIENITEAVGYAHGKGIIHRDLKPSNIMAAKPNQFRVIDFGLGLFVEHDLNSRITKTGEHIIGGYYNAPELIKNPRLIDIRSDIYSIGAIWFTLLTGQPPAGTTISKQLREVQGVNNPYAICIEKCLADISNRYENCKDLLTDIKKIKS